MFKKVLVPLDGSPLADRILTLARPILVQEDTEVVLLRVLADDKPDAAAARKHLEAKRDELSRFGGRVACDIVESHGDAASVILDTANEVGPSLIVLSTHGTTGDQERLRGSVAERVLRRAEQPLFLANPTALGDRPLDMKRILVPLDGSEPGAKVLPLVSNVARVWGAEVVLLHVVDPDEKKKPLGTDAAAVEKLLHDRARKPLDKLKVTTKVAKGAAAKTILEAADSEKADVVALATHGGGHASRWEFGSVAERVLHECSRPLLVYRTSGPERQAVRLP